MTEQLMRVISTGYKDINHPNKIPQTGRSFITRIAGREEGGDRRVIYITDKDPYIWVPADEPIPDSPKIRDESMGYRSYKGKELRRLTLNHPRSTEDVKSNFSEAYESDIPFYRRVSLGGYIGHIKVPKDGKRWKTWDIETDPEYEDPIEPRICIGDIEVLPEKGTSVEEMKKAGEQPIIAATFWDSYEDDYFVLSLDPDDRIDVGVVKEELENHWDEEYSEYIDADFTLKRCRDELTVARQIVNYFERRRFDITGGWNWVDFDWEYMLRYFDTNLPYSQQKGLSDYGDIGSIDYAAETNTVGRVVSGLPAFDMMHAFYEVMNRGNYRSKALDYIAEEELGIGKVEDVNIFEDFEERPSKLLAYNIIDTQLCVELDRENEIFEFFLEVGDMSSIPIYDTV